MYTPARFCLSLFVLACGLRAADPPPQDVPVWRHGPLEIHPFGFLDVIGLTRSATTPDSVSTHFGAIPLGSTAEESVASVAHSRVMLKADYHMRSDLRFTTYLEADFLNPQANAAPWRWRQYFASLTAGRWEILGGQGWSLLRSNRIGTLSDRGLMNTDVIEPAYHVGLAGARHRQARVSYHAGNQSVAAAWQNNGDFEGKWAIDAERSHVEAAAMTGHSGRRALQVSTVAHLTAKLRLVGEGYLARRALNEALSLVANGVDGLATLEGVEWQASRRVEWYSYTGTMRSHRSAGNRTVSEYTTGANWRAHGHPVRGDVMFSLQYSYLDRALWDGRTGSMSMLMYRMRFTIL